MAQPLIGISMYRTRKTGSATINSLSQAYSTTVAGAGGLPLLIPVELPLNQLEALLARVDGLLLTGGGDIQPARFNGHKHPRVGNVDEMRDDLEIQAVLIAANTGLPFLGICRGIQVINVALGGTLYTDIAAQFDTTLRHDQYPDIPRDYLAHTVRIEPGSLLEKIAGAEIMPVNSLHHQAIEKPGAGLTPVAYASDGLLESVELSGHPFGLGVQWHPECIQAEARQREIFKALIRAASV